MVTVATQMQNSYKQSMYLSYMLVINNTAHLVFEFKSQFEQLSLLYDASYPIMIRFL